MSPVSAKPLADLRAELRQRDLNGLIIPHGDEHGAEFPPAHARRLAWISGFTGSAGVAIILADRAALFVDGRYALQARGEVDSRAFEIHHLMATPPFSWLTRALAADQRLGYDPLLHPLRQRDAWRAACQKAGAALVPVTDNPLDAVWHERPPPTHAAIKPHDMAYAGRDSADKIAAIHDTLRANGCRACVLSQLDSIAWLFNIRGGDTPYTPLVRGFAILDTGAAESPPNPSGAVLFIHPRAVDPDSGNQGSRNQGSADSLTAEGLTAHLAPVAGWRPVDDLPKALDALGRAGARVQLDPRREASWLFDRLAAAGAQWHEAEDPCQSPKACKNAVEIAGARAAHRRDGAALCRFLHWLAETAPGEGVDEMSAAARLHALRAENGLFRQPSFGTISATGPHGAIVHYRVNARTNRPLRAGDLYLVDSGGQYADGTTDVTRCVFIGEGAVKEEIRTHFTHVLKGHIALARAVFPPGTRGSHLDSLARLPYGAWVSIMTMAPATGWGAISGFMKDRSESPKSAAMLLCNRG